MSGQVAFKKLEKLAQPKNLEAVFRRFNYKATTPADITSCNATTIAVLKTLTNQVIKRGDEASALTGMMPLVKAGMNGAMTADVKAKLNDGTLVYFGITFKGGLGGDHHFTAFALNGNTVVCSMAWQKFFDLTQWFNENQQGKFPTAPFLALIRGIEDGDVDRVVELCAFLGVSKLGGSIHERICQEVAGTKPGFKGCAYFTLPGQ